MRFISLGIFLVLTVGVGVIIGLTNQPGLWYEELVKPPFNPPNWVFGPVWTVLYVLIAIAGWRAWESGASSKPMILWWVQMALNFLWTPIFFGLQQMGLALAVVLGLLVVILAFIAVNWNRDRFAAWLFIPYAAWVAFASLLNGSLLWLN
jgi:benzodiazapine receptor